VAAFSPDKKLLLTGYEIHVPADHPAHCKYLQVWDVATGRRIRVLKGHKDRISSVTFLPDGKHALSASSDRTMKLWDVASGDVVRHFPVPAGWTGAALSGDGKLVLCWTWDGGEIRQLELWDVDSAKLVRIFQDDPGPCHDLALSRDGKLALSAGDATTPEDTVRLWDVATGKAIRSFDQGQVWLGPVAFSPDGKLATAQRRTPDHQAVQLVLWELTSGKVIRAYPRNREAAFAIAFTADGQQLLTASHDNRVRVWRTDGDNEVRSFEVDYPRDRLNTVAFSADGTLAFSAAGADEAGEYGGMKLKIWDVATGKLLRDLIRAGDGS
jgi:WD40 repeat protein